MVTNEVCVRMDGSKENTEDEVADDVEGSSVAEDTGCGGGGGALEPIAGGGAELGGGGEL